MFTHDQTTYARRTQSPRAGSAAGLTSLLAIGLLLLLATACGAETTGSTGETGTDSGSTADGTTADAGGSGTDTTTGGTDATAGGSDTTSADAGKRPDPVKTTAADLLKIANASVALWADDGTKRIGFLPESKTGKDLVQQDCTVDAPPTGSSGGGTDDCKQEDYDAVKTAKDIKEWFAEQLFDTALVDAKQSTDTLVMLCLTADNACDKETDSQGNETIDAKCAKGLAAVPVCLALKHHGGQLLTGELRIGNTPALVPATFVLNPKEISAKVDLDVAFKSVKMVMKAMEEELPKAFPETATGALSLVLKRDAAATMLSALLHIDKAVHITGLKTSDPEHYNVQLAKAASALSVVFGKDQQAVQVGAKLNAIDLVVAMDLLFGQSAETCGSGSTGSDGTGSGGTGSGSSGGPSPDNCNTPPEKPKTGRIIAALAGLHFDLTFAAGKDADKVSVAGLGFGATTSTIQFHDGTKAHPLLALDLNADAKRMVDLVVAYTGKKIDLTTTPKLDVKVVHTLKVLNPQFDNDIPEFLHAGTSSVSLDGDAKPTFVFETDSGGSTTTPIPAPGGSSGGSGSPGNTSDSGDDFPPMKVLAGLLTLKAVGMPTGMSDVLVTVKAGMCLGEKPKDTSGGATSDKPQHFFGQMAQIVCKP